jgi:signal transduction histidine kinase
VTPRALELHRQALGGETASDDLAWRGRDFHVRVEPLRSDGGEIVGSVGIALDVTEQRRREASYPETQRLESLGVLAGGIAHDLANLLTGVLGHAELALLQLPLDSPARPHLEQAMEGAHRGGDLTHQLLAYAGRAEARREPVALGSLVRGMGDLLRVSLGGGCELRYEISDALPAVEADAAQLRQIVMNLITNGAEAIGDGSGAITIATRVASADAGSALRLPVRRGPDRRRLRRVARHRHRHRHERRRPRAHLRAVLLHQARRPRPRAGRRARHRARARRRDPRRQ